MAGLGTYAANGQFIKWKEMMAEDMLRERQALQREVSGMERTPSTGYVTTVEGGESSTARPRAKEDAKQGHDGAAAVNAPGEPAKEKSIWDWMPIRPSTEEDEKTLPVLGRPNHQRDYAKKGE
jgi:hypothetical protein